jgi:hypothetical protein
MRNLCCFVIALVLSSFVGCGNSAADDELIECTIGEYNFTLGYTFEETSKTWTDLKEETWFEGFYHDTKIYTHCPGRRTITFFFFKSKLSRVEFTLSPDDLRNSKININGDPITFDLTPDAKTQVRESNYTFVLSSFDVDGDTLITSSVEFTGVYEKMRKK